MKPRTQGKKSEAHLHIHQSLLWLLPLLLPLLALPLLQRLCPLRTLQQQERQRRLSPCPLHPARNSRKEVFLTTSVCGEFPRSSGSSESANKPAETLLKSLKQTIISAGG